MSDILNLIRTICKNGESGRLEILAGAIQGELSFRDGKLVDARVGQLTGFQAINAVASMQSARASFDPAFETLASNSIRPSERVVLKQFFGIDTAETYIEPAAPQSALEVADEVTIVSSNSDPKVLRPAPRISYPTALAFAALVIALIGGVVVLLNRLRERSSPAVVAGIESPSRSVDAPVQQSKAQNLSGKWNLVNTVETTSYQTFKNMKIGFHVSIDQNGNSFTGSGHKVSENGRPLPVKSRTPIQVKGSINGDRIEATFSEEGTARKTNGRFVWRVDTAGRGLTGSFATSAARARGKSAAIRL